MATSLAQAIHVKGDGAPTAAFLITVWSLLWHWKASVYSRLEWEQLEAWS